MSVAPPIGRPARTAVFGLWLLFAACPAWGASEGVLRGVVFAEPGDGPVAGAAVQVEGASSGLRAVVTNADGAFRLGLPVGLYRVTISAPGLAVGLVEDVPVVARQATELLATLPALSALPVGPDGTRPTAAAPRVQLQVASGPAEAEELGEDPPLVAQTGPTGTLRILAVDAETGRIVEGARVFLRGSRIEGRTNRMGLAELVVPAGTLDAVVIHPEYSTGSLRELVIRAGETTEARVPLDPAAVRLEELRVTAPRIEGSVLSLVEERRDSAGVADLIGAEQMSKSGDSDAAAALSRVTGITVVGGRYIYVRGLGERYSSTLLNGATLPSPDPERRVVPLDLFPTNALESVLVQKTYSPEMPGDFGGGSIVLRTRGYPKELTGSVSVSTKALVGTTGTEGWDHQGGPTDFLGIDGGYRRPPASVLDATSEGSLSLQNMFSDEGFTKEELAELGRAMPNRWNLNRRTIPPGFGLKASIGDGYEFGDGAEGGFSLGISYDNDWQRILRNETYYRLGAGGALDSTNDYDFEIVNNSIGLSGVLTGGFDWGKNDAQSIRLFGLVTRLTDKETRRYVGFNVDAVGDIRVDRLWWVERMLLTNQAIGSHRLTDTLTLDWRYTFSRASREEPDRRVLRYDFASLLDTYRLSQLSEGNQRLFSDLVDNGHDVGADFTVDVGEEGRVHGTVKTGAAFSFKDRQVDTRRFTFKQDGPLSSADEVLTLDPESVFAPQNIGPEGFLFGEATRPTDNYTAESTLVAGYGQTDLELGHGLRLAGGVRFEYNSIRVSSFEPFAAVATPDVAKLDNFDVLPQSALSWSFYENMVLRLGYARTVSRPDFRELSDAAFKDVVGGRVFRGNPDLERGEIHHVDLRWEWYHSENGDSLSVAGFYKHFIDPIEQVLLAGAEQSVTFDNAKSADSAGIELEFRQSFGLLHEALSDLYLSANASWIYSQIQLNPGGVQTNNQRPLQGQSPFVINATLGYDNPDSGTSAVLLYNIYGRRIVEVGGIGLPDTYEEPFHRLDFVFRQKLGAGFRLSLSAKNIVNDLRSLTQGGESVTSFRTGQSFSVGLGYSK